MSLLTKKQIVDELPIMLASELVRGFQLIECAAIHNQINIEYLQKIFVRYPNRHVSPRLNRIVPTSMCKFILEDPFRRQSSDFIVNIKSMLHHLVIKIMKGLLIMASQISGTFNRHLSPPCSSTNPTFPNHEAN